jgi:hypothetical protein
VDHLQTAQLRMYPLTLPSPPAGERNGVIVS